jgi:hypothetical protein
MEMIGHKTESIYRRRYTITDEARGRFRHASLFSAVQGHHLRELAPGQPIGRGAASNLGPEPRAQLPAGPGTVPFRHRRGRVVRCRDEGIG